MRKTKLALAVTSAIFASSAMATNGTNMTGVGVQSSTMGGSGVAAHYGSENGIVNPAMIGKTTSTEFTFGGTVFMPNVKSSFTGTGGVLIGDSSDTSDANLNVIPSISMATRINDNWSFGIGMWGTSGMGVDYQDNSGLFEAQTTMQVMRFVPTFAYNKDNFGIGLSPVIQYGALDINFDSTGQFGGGGTEFGHGMAQDIGYGYDIGAYFDINENTTLALSYQSEIEMKYKGQLAAAADAFGIGPNGNGNITSDKMAQPAEVKIGIAHKMGNYTLTADAKQVRWGQAVGYKNFGWEDQNVFALGVKYNGNGYWLGAGFNKGDNPIKEQDGTTAPGAALNVLNNLMFPATTETHYSVGGGYKLSKNATLEGAIVMAPETKTEVSAAALGLGTSTTKHSQLGYSVSVRYNF